MKLPEQRLKRAVRVAHVLAAAAALVITSCDSGTATAGRSSDKQFVVNAASTEERRAARVIERLDDAANRGDAHHICRDLLSRASTRGGCVRALTMILRQPIYRKFDIRVRKVRIQGRRATAKVVLGFRGESVRERETYSLVRESGEWRIRLRHLF